MQDKKLVPVTMLIKEQLPRAAVVLKAGMGGKRRYRAGHFRQGRRIGKKFVTMAGSVCGWHFRQEAFILPLLA